ncbi:MAG: hypothetical protein SFW08_08220 [Gemmatimonadaceae bacterium]|nr:hypothetical protein [Gemmatimonadaceae bacterium]
MSSTLRNAAAIAIAAIPAALGAQLSPVPAGNAVAGAYISQAKGYEALWMNPANLAVRNGPKITLGLGNVGVSSSALGLDINQLSDLARSFGDDGNGFDAAAKADILANIPSTGTNIRGQVLVPAASLQIGRLAIGAAIGSVFDYNFGRDLVDLALNGYDQNRVDYRVGNTNGRQATYLDLAAGLGHKIGPLQLGVTGHYIVPRALEQWRIFEPQYDLVNRTFRMDGYSTGTTGGSGWSVDVGGTLNLGLITVSAVLQNAAGKFTWDEANLGYRGFSVTDSNIENIDGVLQDVFKATATPLTATSPLGATQTVQGLYSRAFLPKVFRAGGHLKLPILGTRVSGQYNETIEEGFIGGNWQKYISVGASQKILFFTPSVGYAQSTEPNEGNLFTAGLGLGPINVSVAKLTEGLAAGTSGRKEREGVMVSFGLTLGF